MVTTISEEQKDVNFSFFLFIHKGTIIKCKIGDCVHRSMFSILTILTSFSSIFGIEILLLIASDWKCYSNVVHTIKMNWSVQLLNI